MADSAGDDEMGRTEAGALGGEEMKAAGDETQMDLEGGSQPDLLAHRELVMTPPPSGRYARGVESYGAPSAGGETVGAPSALPDAPTDAPSSRDHTPPQPTSPAGRLPSRAAVAELAGESPISMGNIDLLTGEQVGAAAWQHGAGRTTVDAEEVVDAPICGLDTRVGNRLEGKRECGKEGKRDCVEEGERESVYSDERNETALSGGVSDGAAGQSEASSWHHPTLLGGNLPRREGSGGEETIVAAGGDDRGEDGGEDEKDGGEGGDCLGERMRAETQIFQDENDDNEETEDEDEE